MHFIERIDFFGKLVYNSSCSTKHRGADSDAGLEENKGHVWTLSDGDSMTQVVCKGK